MKDPLVFLSIIQDCYDQKYHNFYIQFMIIIVIQGMPPAGVQTSVERMVVDPGLDDTQKSQQKTSHVPEPEEFEQAPLHIALIAYLNLGLLVVFGYIRDFMRMFGYECTVGAKEWGNEVRYCF